jgi:hypothetical protein
LADWISKSGPAPGIEGLAGKLRLIIADAPIGLLTVERGAVEILPDCDAPAVLRVEDQVTLIQLLGGELHPMVARLQQCVVIEGDSRLALRILLALQAGSPWTGLAPRNKLQ